MQAAVSPHRRTLCSSPVQQCCSSSPLEHHVLTEKLSIASKETLISATHPHIHYINSATRINSVSESVFCVEVFGSSMLIFPFSAIFICILLCYCLLYNGCIQKHTCVVFCLFCCCCKCLYLLLFRLIVLTLFKKKKNTFLIRISFSALDVNAVTHITSQQLNCICSTSSQFVPCKEDHKAISHHH